MPDDSKSANNLASDFNVSTVSKDNPQTSHLKTLQTRLNNSKDNLFLSNSKASPKSQIKSAKLTKSLKNYPYQYSGVPMRKTLPEWNKSAAVLRNTSHTFAIPKAERFPEAKIAYYNHYQIGYKSSLSNRKTTFGLGNKAAIPEVFQAKKSDATKNVPFYEVDDMTLRRNKSETFRRGKTFGLSWNSYKQARTPHRGTVHSSEQLKANPGHKYIICPQTGSLTNKSSIHCRLRMFSEDRAYHKRDEPGPQNYLVNQSQTKAGSLKTNFGLGQKSNFTNNPEYQKVPGPIYNISGFCDKYKNTFIKNCSPNKSKK